MTDRPAFTAVILPWYVRLQPLQNDGVYEVYRGHLGRALRERIRAAQCYEDALHHAFALVRMCIYEEEEEA